MMIPVGEFSQDLVLLERTEKGIERKRKIPVRFVPMTGEAEEHD
jgi:protein-L-isoaspartate O-methyltransferase